MGLISVAINIMNQIIKFLVKEFILKIRFHDKGEDTSSKMRNIFIIQYINTAILLLLIGLNYDFLGYHMLEAPSDDFSSRWYTETGRVIVNTMLINAFMPIVNFFLATIIFRMKRANDQYELSFCKVKKVETKCITIAQYVDLYCGPEMIMHDSYAVIIKTVYVTFTYGFALPVLFPIATLSFLILYFTERVRLAFFYRNPPQFNLTLDNLAISNLKYAPLTMMVLGFWFMGNRQMFFNELGGKMDFAQQPIDSKHNFYHDGIEKSILIPIVLFSALILFQSYYLQFVKKILTFLGVLTLEDDDAVQLMTQRQQVMSDKTKKQNLQITDENLEDYWENLNGTDQKRWFAQEIYFRKELNIKTMNDEMFQNIKTLQRKGKYIKDLYNYDILANLDYADDFAYSQMDHRHEHTSSNFIA